MALSGEFLASAPWAVGAPPNWLETALEAQLAAAHDALPGEPLARGEFLRYLAERLPEDVSIVDSLPRVRTADLRVAFGCVHGQTAALHRLDTDFFSQVRVRGASAEQREEVLQLLRTRLLVAQPGQLSRLSQYKGQGPLVAWLQMSAVRIATEIARKQPSAELQQRAFSDPDLVVDPELDFLKLRYAEQFQRCLDRALREIASGDAALLKLCYLNQTPPSALASMYGVSTRTVQRRIADVRERILELTRGYLQAELSLAPNELDSLLALVQSRLHLSLRLLEPHSGPRTPRG
jgi:RNA polymerase sigma-70 factor (ECF subfamily)